MYIEHVLGRGRNAAVTCHHSEAASCQKVLRRSFYCLGGVQSGKSAFLLLPALSASTGVSLPPDTVVSPLQLVPGLAWLLFLSGIFLPPGFMRQ